MYDTLMKYQTRNKFFDYEKSVNNLYNMYYEMLEQPVKEDITIYDKANELDEYYQEINGKYPEKFCDVRYLIIDDYKAFNPEYIKETHKGWKTCAFTTDFVKEELKKENCELISEYINGNTPIEYVFDNVKYKVLFKNWRHKQYRPHLYFKHKYPVSHQDYIKRKQYLNKIKNYISIKSN